MELMRTEGVQFALNFLRKENLTQEEMISEAKIAVEMIRGRLTAIDDARGATHFVFGGLINKLHENDTWKNVGWAGQEEWWAWGDFCRNALRISLPKANALKRIWTQAQKVNLTPEEIDEMGWSCSATVLRVAKTPEAVREIVGDYRNCMDEGGNKADFLDRLQEKSARANGTLIEGGGQLTVTAKKLERMLHFTPEESIFFDETIEAASNKMNRILGVSIGQSECLIYVLTQWRHFVANS